MLSESEPPRTDGKFHGFRTAIGNTAVWEPGNWSWGGGQYNSIPGHYIERRGPTANWIPGYWQQGSGGWMWVEGLWAQ
jgi:hypothetical protein